VRALVLAGAVAAAGCAAAGELPPDPDAGAAPACASGVFWGRGDRGDNEMHPGVACIGCHQTWRRGPTFSVAGTVFGGLNDENDCDGYPSDDSDQGHRARIEVVDGTNHRFLIFANRVGNFYTTFPLRPPLRHVRVISPEGAIVEMSAPAPHGDCNACHARDGTTTPTGMAPGRIVIPSL
jgi:hypothetical protein